MDDLLVKKPATQHETRHNRKSRVKANRLEETKKQDRKVRRKARIVRRKAAEEANANWPQEKLRREEKKIADAKKAEEKKEADRLAKEEAVQKEREAMLKKEAEALVAITKAADEAAELAALEAEEAAKPKGILAKIGGAIKDAIMGPEKKE